MAEVECWGFDVGVLFLLVLISGKAEVKDVVELGLDDVFLAVVMVVVAFSAFAVVFSVDVTTLTAVVDSVPLLDVFEAVYSVVCLLSVEMLLGAVVDQLEEAFDVN